MFVSPLVVSRFSCSIAGLSVVKSTQKRIGRTSPRETQNDTILSPERSKIDQERTENQAKSVPKSILDRPGRLRSIRGRPGTSPGSPRDGQKHAQAVPRALLGRPGPPKARLGPRQERSKMLRESSREIRRAGLSRRTPRQTLAHRFSKVFATKIHRFS